MGLSNTERIMARRQVDAEIKADPVTIFPARRTKISDNAGGWYWSDWSPVNEEGFEVTIIPAKRRLSDMLAGTELGDVVRAPYIALGRNTVDLKREDQFDWNGDRFQVISIQVKTEVSVTAQVDYFGGANNG